MAECAMIGQRVEFVWKSGTTTAGTLVWLWRGLPGMDFPDQIWFGIAEEGTQPRTVVWGRLEDIKACIIARPGGENDVKST